MSAVVSLVAGAAAGIVLLVAMGGVLGAPFLQRWNYRGRSLPTAGGLVIVFAVVVVTAGYALADGLGAERGVTAPRAAVLFTVLGFGFLGFVDDIVGTPTDRGFKGHLHALAGGTLTTGGVKLFIGALLAIAIAATPTVESAGRLLVDAAIVALAANLGNIFDRAPGRVIKVGLVAYVPLAFAAGASATGAALAPVMGAVLALFAADQRERLMLGDTGANVIGAVLGLGVVLVGDGVTRAVVLAGLVAFNLAAEFVSFSRVIDAVPPLRAIDRLGRVRE